MLYASQLKYLDRYATSIADKKNNMKERLRNRCPYVPGVRAGFDRNRIHRRQLNPWLSNKSATE